MSRTSSVIAIANTPSLNASIRPVSQRLPTTAGSTLDRRVLLRGRRSRPTPTRSVGRGSAPRSAGTRGSRALAGSLAGPSGCGPRLACSCGRARWRARRTTLTSPPRDRHSSGTPARRCRASESAPAVSGAALSSSSRSRSRGCPRTRRRAASEESTGSSSSRPSARHRGGSCARRVRSRRGVRESPRSRPPRCGHRRGSPAAGHSRRTMRRPRSRGPRSSNTPRGTRAPTRVRSRPRHRHEE